MDPLARPPSSGSFDIDQKILSLMRGKHIVVPPYPAVALKLHEVTNRQSFAITDVVDVVQNDQTLTATVLRAANSAVFAGLGAATTLQQAVSRLGASEVSRVALMAGLNAAAKAPGGLQALRRQTWAEGVASAAISHALARARGLSQRDAFTCGLLHDFGKIVGVAALEQVLAAHPSVAAQPEEEWRKSLARALPEINALVAAAWNLPPLLQQAMTLRTSRAWAKSAYAPLLEVVAAGDEVIGLMMRMAHVGALELSGLASLRPNELEPLAEILPGIPQTIAAFEAEPSPKPAPSKIAQPATTLGTEPQRALRLTVNQLQPQKRGPYQMISINNSGWAMEGAQSLPERQMFEAEIAVPAAPGANAPPFKLWASTPLVVQDGGLQRIECKPFALDRDGKKRWAELVASAKT